MKEQIVLSLVRVFFPGISNQSLEHEVSGGTLGLSVIKAITCKNRSGQNEQKYFQ